MFEKKTHSGIIIKSIGGIYTVDAPEGVFECKARGIFRKNNISPCCGDNVDVLCEDENSNVITAINSRRNHIIRPPLSNLDQLIFVVSTCEPDPNYLLLDKFIAVCVYENITPVIVMTKIDKSFVEDALHIYSKADIKVLFVNNMNGEGCDDVRCILNGKISAFTGNSGVGKSTLLNNIFPDLSLATNEISKSLGRGKHTTRHVELYKLPDGGYVADTPGFSTFETNKYDIIRKEELADCFTEFSEYTPHCRFPDCSHTKEKGCAVIEAVNNGDISKSRHDSYVEMYEEAKNIKEWEINKKQ